ncbi:trimeric intracellular cation channel family protein [Desulforamulus putei]|uniref:trimeric intracellular cation channel family protein n=1 Tax=Desulforamulus putei TaxID=74701 RepID=UPI002FDCD166
MTILYFLDLLGTFAFALSGALAAIKKEMDLFGVVVLALVTAIGGGTTRDVLLGNTPVFILNEPIYIYVSLAGAVCTFLFYRSLFKINSIILIVDALGLGTFVCIGVSMALEAGISFAGAVMMGVITAVMGGIIRDVLSGEVPSVLTRDFYAMTCVVGGILYIVLYRQNVSPNVVMPLTTTFIFTLRLMAIRFKWNFIKAPYPLQRQ